MFDTKKNVSTRVADAVDLTIDFATLGEYGLEPVGAVAARPCEARHRRNSRSTGAWTAAVARFAAHP